MRGVRACLMLVVAVLCMTAGCGWADWVELTGCRLADNESNDGDSFHVKHKGREYVFRLYFVDAPETSELIPSRVREQAEAFETTQEDVLASGKDAAKFTRKRLGGDFKVVTRWEDARGMTKGGRHYAFVETGEGEDLGELLVAAGWARSYGMKAATKSRPAAQLQQGYDRLEQKARRAGAGIWGDGQGAAVALDEETDDDISVGRKNGKEAPEEDGDAAMSGGLMDAALAATTLAVGASSEAAEPRPSPSPSASPRPVAPDATPSPARPSPTAKGQAKLDINTATKEELMALPGIDEARASAIIAARPFAGSYELLKVPGIGPATLKEVYPFIAD